MIGDVRRFEDQIGVKISHKFIRFATSIANNFNIVRWKGWTVLDNFLNGWKWKEKRKRDAKILVEENN